MDNLTHSLVGAMLGQVGLKRLSGLGMPTLVIAANIPDIDATCTIYGTASLAMRRGLTHGPVAMVVLPVLLAGAMVAFDRWQAQRGKRPTSRPAVRFVPLLLLAVIGTLSHPAFDWLNSYGIRLLEPFSSRWFYGDALFIIDVWVWALLLGGLLWTRRAERAGAGWQRRGQIVLGVLAAYVAGNVAISQLASGIALADAPYPAVAVANPVPVAFWRREVLWRTGDRYGRFGYSLFRGVQRDDVVGQPIGMTPAIAARAAAAGPDAQAFLFWSRLPIARAERGQIVLRDQRFDNPVLGDRFSVRFAQ